MASASDFIGSIPFWTWIDQDLWMEIHLPTISGWNHWFMREMIPKWPKFRLVNYYNLPRTISFGVHTSGLGQPQGETRVPFVGAVHFLMGDVHFHGVVWDTIRPTSKKFVATIYACFFEAG